MRGGAADRSACRLLSLTLLSPSLVVAILVQEVVRIDALLACLSQCK